YLRFFEVETQKEIFKPFYLGRYLYPYEAIGCCLSDDNKLVAVQVKFGSIKIYDLKTQKKNVVVPVRSNFIMGSFAHQDKYLWGYINEKVSHKNKISFYDIQTGEELFELICFFGNVKNWAIAAADGRYDGTKEILDYIKIKPAHLPNKPENYFSPKDKPNLHVDGLLATFFNVPMPNHYWFKTSEQIQPIINQQQIQNQIQQQKSAVHNTTVIPLPPIKNK
ncbi:MAG: hypothetical protein LBB88_05885, partial [Planctomycetaceae bacterium]|nr:hypothetical protein [Planctomycetaceae bacterium]